MIFFHKAKYSIQDIGLKSDIHCHIVPGVDDDFESMSSTPLLYPDGNHILIEMSYYERSRNILDQIFRLREMELTPILAHPERYCFYQESPASMAELEKSLIWGASFS